MAEAVWQELIWVEPEQSPEPKGVWQGSVEKDNVRRSQSKLGSLRHLCHSAFVGRAPKDLIERSPSGHLSLNVLSRPFWERLEPSDSQLID